MSNRAPLRVELLEDRNLAGSLLDAMLANALLDMNIPRSLAGCDTAMYVATFAATSQSFDAPYECSQKLFVGSPLSDTAQARTSEPNELRTRQTDESLATLGDVFRPAVGNGPAFQVARGSEAIPSDATPRRAMNSNDPTTPVATPSNSNYSTLSTLSEPGSPDPVPLTPVVTVEATEDEAELSTDGVFTLSRTGDLTATLTVNYTIGGTATAGDDYTALSGSVTFATSAATVAVSVIDDLLPESQETVAITITDAATYDPGSASSAALTILDEDNANTSIALSASPTSAPVGEPITFTAAVSSSDGIPSGTVSFFAGAVALGSGPLDSAGLASITVTDLAHGVHTLMASYSGDSLYAASNSSPITVAANTAPVLLDVGMISVLDGQSLTLQLSATDADGDPITYSAVELPGGLTLDADSGLISGFVDANASAAVAGGRYAVTVTATDSISPALATIDLVVSPRIVVSIEDQQNVEGDSIGVQVQASTPDASPLTYSATNLPLGVSIDLVTGFITGIVSPETAGLGGSGYQLATVTVTDGMYSSTTAFSWVVLPRIVVTVPNGNQDSVEGDNVSVQVQASTPDVTPLTYSAANLPAGVSINATTGLITGTISTVNTAGNYSVTVTVTNGLYIGRAFFNWAVRAAGADNPLIKSVAWTQKDGATGGTLGAQPADTPGGGQRIFAEKKKPKDETVADEVVVRVELTMAKKDVPIKLYLYDVDDPSSADKEIDNEKKPTDNRGTTASLATVIAGVTDADGVFVTTVKVSRQPGDNFRAVATIEDIDFVKAIAAKQDDGKKAGVYYTANNAAVATGDAKTVTSGLLTVWRTLHAERDHMGKPGPNEVFDGAGVNKTANGADDVDPKGAIADVSIAHLTKSMAAAYVLVVDDLGDLNKNSEWEFVHNASRFVISAGGNLVGPVAVKAAKRDVAPQNEFWTSQILSAYEYIVAEDGDGEGKRTFGVAFANVAAVFTETIRDGITEFAPFPTIVDMATALQYTLTHEVGHLFGADHPENGIMTEGSGAYFTKNEPELAVYFPVTLNRIRSIAKPE